MEEGVTDLKNSKILTFFVMFILVGAAIGALYFFGGTLTGFAVFNQADQTEFDLGTYNNTEWNGSAVALGSGNTSGTYTSKIFDASEDATWNNLTYVSTTPDVDFLFSADNQADIWQSVGGTTWSLAKDDYNGGDGNGATQLVKNSSNDLFILYNQDVWASVDLGVSWTKVNDDFNPSDSNSGLVIEIDSDDYIYIADGSGDIWKSTDSGVSFSNINDVFGDANDAGAITSDSNDNLYIVDNSADVFSSTDSGVTWTLINDDYNGGNSNAVSGMSSNSTDALFVLHNQDVWQSFDFGVTWTLVNDDYNGGGDSNSGQVIYIDDNDYIYVIDGSEDVYQSTDSGVSFARLVENFNGGNGNALGLTSASDATSLSFQVRNCSQSDCSDGSWESVDLNNINLIARYFQYKISYLTPDSGTTPFLESIVLDYDVLNIAPIINITQPQDTLYTENENLNLNYTVTDGDGNLDSCWYTLDSGATNTTLVTCANSTFTVADYGSYTLIVYANDTQGEEASDSVSFSVDVDGVSLIISEPTGTKTSRTGIPLTYTATGNSLTCWYNVKTSIGGDIISNTTLSSCDGTTFDVSVDGDFVVNLYANNTLGSFDSTLSPFSVDTSEISSGENGGSSGGSGGSFSRQTGGSSPLSFKGLSNFVVTPGETKIINLIVKNGGGKFLNDCEFKGVGEYASWISFNEIKSLAIGEEYEFIFEFNVPTNLVSGKYNLEILTECKELTVSEVFVVEILTKELNFELIKVERNEKDMVKIIYSLEELSGIKQNVELQFLLFSVDNEKVGEIKEDKLINPNEVQEFETLLPIDSSLKGELGLLINLNSEIYSTFVQENIVLGSPISGFPVLGEFGGTDKAISFLLVGCFLVFGFFVVKKILKHRKKIK